jgi:hypothetical protein
MMLKPSVSTCANPGCSAEFRRLGEGKLYTEPPNVHVKGRARRMVWMCNACSRTHTIRYDREKLDFVIFPHHKRGKAA